MLFVAPCSLGQVPVIIVYQPTPVFGKPGCMPLTPLTPVSMSDFIVGIWPAAAYASTLSGRMPSAEKKRALVASGPGGGGGAALVGMTSDDARTAIAATTAAN